MESNWQGLWPSWNSSISDTWWGLSVGELLLCMLEEQWLAPDTKDSHEWAGSSLCRSGVVTGKTYMESESAGTRSEYMEEVVVGVQHQLLYRYWTCVVKMTHWKREIRIAVYLVIKHSDAFVFCNCHCLVIFGRNVLLPINAQLFLARLAELVVYNHSKAVCVLTRVKAVCVCLCVNQGESWLCVCVLTRVKAVCVSVC